MGSITVFLEGHTCSPHVFPIITNMISVISIRNIVIIIVIITAKYYYHCYHYALLSELSLCSWPSAARCPPASPPRGGPALEADAKDHVLSITCLSLSLSIYIYIPLYVIGIMYVYAYIYIYICMYTHI